MSMATSPELAITIPLENGRILGDLKVPEMPRGLVIFVHGSGSTRMSRRNRLVARILNDAGLATLLVDLLTSDEERTDARTARLRFDISLLSERVEQIIEWARTAEPVRGLEIGLFGASTGAAAALVAAAHEPAVVAAVVGRGGRPDLAGDKLADVEAPTLFVVGSLDTQVLALNEQAARLMQCEHHLEIVRGATHLFEEPGTLDRAAELAAAWFVDHLGSGDGDPGQVRRSWKGSTADVRSVDFATPAPPPGTTTATLLDQPPRTGPYRDRQEAGEVLARVLAPARAAMIDPLIIALPRGGVEVAIPIARTLQVPVDVVVARKLVAPDQADIAIGAVDEDGEVVVDERMLRRLDVTMEQVHALATPALEHARRRADLLRDRRPVTPVIGRDIVLVDEGYVTGMSSIAAARFLKRNGARHIILAVPVAPRELLLDTPRDFDRVVCPYSPATFQSVSQQYLHFDRVPDFRVRALLHAHGPVSSARYTPTSWMR